MKRLDEWRQAGALRAIDVELGELIARLDGRRSEPLALAAAAASQAVAQGHSCLPLSKLGELMLHAGAPRIVLPSLDDLREALRTSVLVAGAPGAATPLVFDGEDRLWLRRYHDHEQRVAAALRARAAATLDLEPPARLRAKIARWLPASTPAIDWQAIAIALALRSRLTIVSGGPGTGKTTTVLWMLLALLEAAEASGAPLPRIRLAAPTGKAAARLGESIRQRTAAIDCSDAVRAAIRDDEAATIHRLLGFHPDAGFRHHRGHRLDADVVVVDEASMVDLPMMSHLLESLDDACALILLGDVGQLASVEAGHVLAAIGARGDAVNRYSPATAEWLRATTGYAVPIGVNAESLLGDCFVELRHSHRFDDASGIGRLARAVRAGAADAAIDALAHGAPAIEWQPGVAAENALQRDWRERFERIAAAPDAAAALAIAAEFRVLTAVRHGRNGCVEINRALESTRDARHGWYHGRLVIIAANDYRHALFNGDTGVAFQAGDERVQVWFAGVDGIGVDGSDGDGRLRAFAPYTLPPHEAAFALTVHKAQGSEFDEIAVVLPDAMSPVLGRELLYTALTRARRKVHVFGDEAIVRAAIARPIERWSGLPDLLRTSRAVDRGN